MLAGRLVEAIGCVIGEPRNAAHRERAVGPKDKEGCDRQESNVETPGDLLEPSRQCPHLPNAFRSPPRQGASTGCGIGCCVGKISILRHVLVNQEIVDSARTHWERQVPCCSQVLFWTKAHLQKLRRTTGHARADDWCLRTIHIATSRIEPLSLLSVKGGRYQVYHKGKGSTSHPSRREHLEHKLFRRPCCGKANRTEFGMVSPS